MLSRNISGRWYFAIRRWNQIQDLASFSARGSQRQIPKTLIRRRMTFWITSELLLSNQPSAIQAIEAMRKITKPETVIRAANIKAE
jgi:hypothetical protein